MEADGNDLSSKTRWLENVSKVDVAAIILSVLALAISILSYAETKRAADIAEASFRSNEKAIWRIEADKEGYKFLDPNEAVLGQQILITTPKALGGDKWNVMVSERIYSISRVEKEIIDSLKLFVKENDDYIKVGTIGFPVVVESYFVVNGKQIEDTSVYILNFTYSSATSTKDWSVTPTSAFFSGRAADGEPPVDIDEFWKLTLTSAFIRQHEGK